MASGRVAYAGLADWTVCVFVRCSMEEGLAHRGAGEATCVKFDLR